MMKRLPYLIVGFLVLAVVIAGLIAFLRSDVYLDLGRSAEEAACRRFLKSETTTPRETPLADIRELRILHATIPEHEIKAVERGKIEFDEVKLVPRQLHGGELTVLAVLPNLEELTVSNYKGFGDELARSLPSLPQLKRLRLLRTSVTEKVFPTVAAMKQLDDVMIGRYMDFTDEKTVRWSPPDPWTDKSLEILAESKSLTSIRLEGPSEISDAGLRKLWKMQQLKSIHLDAPRVTRKQADSLSMLPRIQSVWIESADKSKSFTTETIENGKQRIVYRYNDVSETDSIQKQ